MKSVLGVLALVANCAFVASYNVTIGTMEYVGPITPGGTNVTLYGTAEVSYYILHVVLEQQPHSNYYTRGFTSRFEP